MEPIEVLSSIQEFKPVHDTRPVIPVPPPVRLVAIDDVRLPANTGLERDLDSFYVKILGFERESKADLIVYKSENYRLRFEQIEPLIEREDFRFTEIEVKSLGDVARRLREAEIEFARERSITLGRERLVLADPAGNWCHVSETRVIF